MSRTRDAFTDLQWNYFSEQFARERTPKCPISWEKSHLEWTVLNNRVNESTSWRHTQPADPPTAMSIEFKLTTFTSGGLLFAVWPLFSTFIQGKSTPGSPRSHFNDSSACCLWHRSSQKAALQALLDSCMTLAAWLRPQFAQSFSGKRCSQVVNMAKTSWQKEKRCLWR